MDLEENEIKEAKEKYFKVLKDLDISFYNLINRESHLINIINNSQVENDKLYNLIIDDYYTIFLNNALKKTNNKKNKKENKKGKNDGNINIDENKRFLKLMTSLRNDIIISNFKEEYSKENDIIKKLAKEINWLESYKNEISIIQQIFSKLNMKNIVIYEQIEKVIKEKEIKYEISKRNPEYTSIVNEVFFLSLDSMLRIITCNYQLYQDKSNEALFELINVNKEVFQNSLQMENTLYMRSKEVFSLQQILKLIDALYSNKLNSNKNFEVIFLYFKNQIIYNNMQMQRKLCDNFTEFYKFLNEQLANLNNNNFNFYKVLSSVFLNEYIKITYNSFRELLIQKILENNDFIKNSSQIFKIILENLIDSKPVSMIDNFVYIKEEKSEIFKKINNAKNPFLDEVIMKYMIYLMKISLN